MASASEPNFCIKTEIVKATHNLTEIRISVFNSISNTKIEDDSTCLDVRKLETKIIPSTALEPPTSFNNNTIRKPNVSLRKLVRQIRVESDTDQRDIGQLGDETNNNIGESGQTHNENSENQAESFVADDNQANDNTSESEQTHNESSKNQTESFKAEDNEIEKETVDQIIDQIYRVGKEYHCPRCSYHYHRSYNVKRHIRALHR